MWDDIELLASDDTGSGWLTLQNRQEAGNVLYQMNTLAKITSSEQVLSKPTLYACNSDDGCVLVADKAVMVVDRACQALQMFLQFDAKVDIVGLCQEGQFLVVGERSGSLHLIHVPSKQTLLTKVLVQTSSDSRTYLDLILSKDGHSGGIYHAFILTSNGFFCILHLPLAQVQEAIEKRDFGAAKKLQVETSFISTKEYHTVGCLTSAAQSTTKKISLIIGGEGDSVISVWEVNLHKKQVAIQNVADSSMIKAAKKLQLVDYLLFVLDNENILSLWDVYSLTLTWECSSVPIKEFLLTSESDCSASTGQGIANLKLVALCQSDDTGMENIMIFSLPSMLQLYSLEVTNVSSLVQSGINTDTIYFLEGMYENNEKASELPVSYLVLRCLTESLPENRLSRLLHKHQFTEAENFALQFGLDVELVYKVKISSILERLASEFAGNGGQSAWLELVPQAKETLDKIKDNQFVVDYCINTPWPTLESAQDLLNYARHRVLNYGDAAVASLSACDPVSLSEVLRAQTKLTTFYGAFGSEKFSGAAWLDFLNRRDVFKDILSQLKTGNLSSAQYIWLRHQTDVESSFHLEMLKNLLNSIPVAAPLEDLCLWLKDAVLPFVRRVLPEGQKIIAEWLEQGARNLELTDKANWPENGLKMAEIFFTSKDPEEIELRISLKDNHVEEICRLMKLVRDLQGLIDLFRKYDCRLALCDFEKENANTIVFRMFDKILAAELIPATLEKYIEPFMVHHNLPRDEILLQYIKDFLERHCKRSTSVFDTTWEAKAIAVLDCMSNIDLIIEGVLAVMHSAGVPWSLGVEQLVQKYLHLDHPKVKLLLEGYRLMEMKTLLRSYGIRDTNLLNSNQTIVMLVKYILKQDTPSSLEDALKIANTYMLVPSDVYVWRIVNLIEEGKGDEVLDLLRSLNPVEAAEVAEKIFIWGRLTVEMQSDGSEGEWKFQLSVKKILVEVLKCLISHQKENILKKEEYEADLKLFKTLAVLQENFDICLSVKDYRDPSVIPELLNKCIKSYDRMKAGRKRQNEGASLEDGSIKTPWTQSRLHRLVLTLGVPEHTLASELVLKTLESGNVEEALKICRDFCEGLPSERTGLLLFLASQKLCHMLTSDSLMPLPNKINLPAVVHAMASEAVTFCSLDLILDALELGKCTSFAHEIYDKGQMEDFGFMSKTTSFGTDKDPYEEWMFDDVFKEDGAVLDPPTLLPSAYEMTSCMVPLAERVPYPLDAVSLVYRPLKQGMSLCLACRNPVSFLLNRLQECSQFELALELILSSGALLQHMIANSMEAGFDKKKTQDDAKTFLVTMAETTSSVVRSIVTALLHKVFSSQRVDHNLAFAYCTLLPKDVIFKRLWDIINGTPQNYSKILAIGFVGTQLADRYEEKKEKQAFEELIIDAEWGIQLDKLEISFQHLFRMPSVRKKELLKKLVQHPKVTTDLLLKYCNTFQLDTDAVFQLYIETSFLQNGSLEYKEGDTLGNSGPHPAALVAARAAEVLPLLRSTSGLITSLCTTLYKLDPYNYESIESLLKIIEKADGEVAGFSVNLALMLIKHLKSYTRTSTPGDLETQYVLEQAMPLSPAAQTRLPFHLIFFRTSKCFWKIIPAELNEDSFPKLLLVSKLMKVSLDTLHMYAAMHVFKEKLKPKILELTRRGCLLTTDKEAVRSMWSIQSYLLSIVNLEWATAVAHKIAQDLPTGPCKVQALELCCSLAEKWLKSATDKGERHLQVQTHLKKLQLEHQKSATEAVLLAHRLDLEAHQKLSGKPAHLVILLYQHRSISERFQNPTGRDYPDIHALAEEIAEINNLDMKKIWDMLLEKWLCPNVTPTEKISEIFENIQEDEDFKRVLYLLQLYPVDRSSRILHKCATSTTSPIGVNQLTFGHRSRALQCLLHLADPHTLESLFKTPIEKIKHLLKCFVFLAEFEILKIPYTYECFHSAPKEGIIKGLWKNHSHEPRAVKLVTELSLEYKVHDPLLWNSLLQKLIGFNVTRYLRKVLVEITGIYSLWQIPNFNRAWQSVVLALAISAPHSASPNPLGVCLESFKTLLKCPVLSDLDLMKISKQYAQLEFPALALGGLLLIPDFGKRTEQIRTLLALCQLDVILEQVEQHMSVGEVAPFGRQIREQILDYFIHEKYATFETAKYFPLLKLGQKGPQKVKALVEKLVDQNRMDEAATLAREYLKRSGNLLPPDDIVKTYFSELIQIPIPEEQVC